MLGNKITKILLLVSVAVFLFGSGFKLGEYKMRFVNIGELKKTKIVMPAKLVEQAKTTRVKS